MMSLSAKFREWERWISENSPASWDDAYRPSLQTSPGMTVSYVVYRWGQFTLLSLIFVMSVVESTSLKTVVTHDLTWMAKSLLHIPNWMAAGNVAQSLLGAVVVAWGYFAARRPDPSTNEETLDSTAAAPLSAAAAYAAIFNAAVNLSSYVGLGTAGARAVFKFVDTSRSLFDWKISAGALVMLADLFVVRFPYTLITGLYTLGILWAYLLLTFVYFKMAALDRHSKQPLLDWNNPVNVLVSFIVSVILMEGANLVLFGLYQIRRQYVTQPIRHPPPPPPPRRESPQPAPSVLDLQDVEQTTVEPGKKTSKEGEPHGDKPMKDSGHGKHEKSSKKEKPKKQNHGS